MAPVVDAGWNQRMDETDAPFSRSHTLTHTHTSTEHVRSTARATDIQTPFHTLPQSQAKRLAWRPFGPHKHSRIYNSSGSLFSAFFFMFCFPSTRNSSRHHIIPVAVVARSILETCCFYMNFKQTVRVGELLLSFWDFVKYIFPPVLRIV